jgi:alkanesulfonate monooxygenase SsuD/methylene tetrahydromethanopterin reductase-like flavin-dependent oxidoreductase (luciferase family)
MRLGTSVLLTLLRNPVQLARSLSRLDQLSQGRLEVGIGLGGEPRVYPAFGIPPEHRVARFTEGLDVGDRRGGRFEGRFWRLDDARMEPKPVQ